MGLVYTIDTLPIDDSDEGFSRVISFEQSQDNLKDGDFVLVGPNNPSDSADQHSSKFVSNIFKLTSAWGKKGFFRFVERAFFLPITERPTNKLWIVIFS